MSEERKAIIAAADEARRAALADTSGETPLHYMLRVMRDQAADDKRRDTMAVAAAAFMHPKLNAIEHSGNDKKPLTYQIVSGVDRDGTVDDDFEHMNGVSNGRADH